MPRRTTRLAPTILVPGLDGSGLGHWQVWLAGELRAQGRIAEFPDLPDLDTPHLTKWLEGLRAKLTEFGDLEFDVVTHSLGAVLWMHHCVEGLDYPKPSRVALIAVPAPDIAVPACEEFFPVPFDVDALRRGADGTVLVGSDNDPFCPRGIAQTYGAPLKMATTVIPNAGHLNVDSGHGPWPAVLDWCSRDNLAFIA